MVLTYSQSHPLDMHAEVWISLKYDVLTHLGLPALNVRLQSHKPQYFPSEIPKLADSSILNMSLKSASILAEGHHVYVPSLAEGWLW